MFQRRYSGYLAQLVLWDSQTKFVTLIDSNISSPHELYDKFVTKFENVVDEFAPMRKASRKENKLRCRPWLTRGLLKSIRIKNKTYNNLREKPDTSQSHKYKIYRNLLNRLIKQAKVDYYHNVLKDNKNNSKKVWNIVNELVYNRKQKNSGPTKILTDTGCTITDPQAIAEEFNKFFVSVGKRMAAKISAHDKPPDTQSNLNKIKKISNSIFLSPCTPQEVFNLITKLKDRKALRTIDIETRFIKLANPVISTFLSNLFNVCLNTGVYPDSLKIAEVIPIFKKGCSTQTTNYRPISLLCQFNKIFEKLLHTRIYSYLIRYNLLNDRQFGFRKNSSTTLAISKIHNDLLHNIDQGLYSCSLFLDLSKAFDSVDHAILIKKLECMYGFRGIALELMKSYFNNRYQYTKISKSKSTLRKIKCGVPQGSSLGPLLFILYINDLPLASEFSTTLFADDTYLTLSHNNLFELEKKVNIQMHHIDNWMCQNKLSLNYSKTTYLLFNKHLPSAVNTNFKVLINNIQIDRNKVVKYLGVHIDENLNWSAHIKELSLQLAKCCSLLYQLREYVTTETLHMLYYSFAYSRIQYGITIWGTASQNQVHEIEVRLNNIIRTITCSKKFAHVTKLYKKLNFLKIKDVYKLELAKFMHKLFSNKLPEMFQNSFTKIGNIHNYETRNNITANYFLPRASKKTGHKKLQYRGVKLWNEIDVNLKKLPLHTFNKQYKNALLSTY